MWLFCLTFFVSAMFLAGSMSANDVDVAFSKCWEQKSRTLKSTDFVWYSSSVLGEITNCIEKSIFDSENLCDQMFMRDINIKRLNNALRHFCSKYDVQSCREDLFKKNALSEKHFDVKLKSYAYCIFDRYQTCNTSVAQIIQDNKDDVKSNATHVFLAGGLCDKEIEAVLVKCWTHIPEPFEQIKKYGKSFYDNITKCVEGAIYDSEHLHDQQNFDLCSKFDVVTCQEDYYTRDYGVPKSVDELLTIYANCVYDKYTTCDTTLDKIIKYNLVSIKTFKLVSSRSYKSVAMHSNAEDLSVSLVMIVSYVTIILSLFF